MIPRHLVILTAVLFSLAVLMSIYVWQLQRREAQKAPPARAAEHVSPPPSGPVEQATVWVPDEKQGELRAQKVSLPLNPVRQQKAGELMRALIAMYARKDSPHPLAAGAEVHAIYLVDPGLAVLDLNAAFVDTQTSGILAEELTVLSIVQTLASNIPGIVRVKILVDGKERETLAGHLDLAGFYDAAEVAELAHQLTAR
jgi:Sporulation and spore germination